MKATLSMENFEKIPNSILDDVTKNVSEEEIFNTSQNNNSNEFNLNNDPEDSEEELTEDTEGDLKNNVGELISGEFITDLMDTIIPSIIIVSIHFIGYQLEDKKSLYLTVKDKKVVGKAMQRALNAINIDLTNPFYNLALVVTIVYGSKIIEQIPNIKKVDKRKKAIEEKEIQDLKELAKPTDEQLFNDAFDKLADEVVKEGRKKTRFAAKKMLLKEKIDSVNILREEYNLPPLTDNGNDTENNFSL